MRLRRAFAIVIALVAIVLGVAVVSGFQLYEGAVSEQEQQSLETTAEATATQIEGLLAERSRTIELSASDPLMANASERRRAALRRIVRQTPYQGISVIDANGTMTAIESRGLSEENRSALLGQDFSDRTYFQRAMDGETYVSEPVEAETGNLIVTVSAPITRDGEPVGTLNGALHIRDGSFFETLTLTEDTDYEFAIRTADQQLYASASMPDASGGPTASATVDSTGWTVTTTRLDSTRDETRLVTGLQVAAGLLIVLSLVGFGVWFKRSNLNQIEELLAGFDRLADRSYGTQIAVGGAQEWDKIGARFNEVSEELARHERELKQYRQIVERVNDPITIQATDGSHELANHALTELSGYSRDEILGADESLYMDAESAERIEAKRREVLDTEQPVEFECTSTFERTGTEATFSTQLYPYYDEDGTLAGTLSVYRDVSTLKARETELEQYKRAVDGATDLICAIDDDGEYLFANPQYCAYHGVDPEELPGMQTTDLFDQEAYDYITEYTDRALDGETIKYKMTRTHPNEGTRILDVRYFPLETDGEVTGFVAVLRDVTEREERARQLRVVDRVLRHNLRNDLTVISLEAERIGAGANGEIADAAETIQDHADSLLTTSNKSRGITEILSEQADSCQVDVADVVRTAGADIADADVTIDAPDEATVSAAADLYRAIDELVTNAVVHSDRERPSISLSVDDTDEHVTITVADDGPGIPKMDRDVLESGRTIEDLYHGSGLGLWLVHWIVQRSGGSITVRDRSPRGSVIEIQLRKNGA
ncbi:PAS domain-containing protein [Halovenus sp. WSH3]|uniref:histidine kinase n=1 Tax=Halovenus carboxidivorans TaxID=2692199 RepID=A0A6B0T6E2_9EURY|nr:PAS domain-containing protein [Halovenus carboxidivorans]MXR51143.1 PAS domain-containing protein [Halovenus carboxidivorans]